MKEQKHYQFPIHFGRYSLKKFIGQGNLGEVFFAEDPICQRTVALKRLKKEFLKKPSVRKSFIQEAKITAQLSHPSIIPIYSIHEDLDAVYYTMPYIEGETLLDLLTITLDSKLYGKPNHPVGSSIYSLILIFLNLCYAIKHCHIKGFLHRDLKAKNIIVHNSTQVVIIDWKMAIHTKKTEEFQKINKGQTTLEKFNQSFRSPEHPTATFDNIEPESLFEYPSTYQSDIYSLGVVLYHMLTLKKPFHRPNNAHEWKNQIIEKGAEKIIDPQLIATDREITPQLAHIALKCLANQNNRYEDVGQIITELQNYIQGKPEWSLLKKYLINNSSHWEFQENILLSKHMAVSRYAGTMEWVMLMLSKESFYGNIRIETKIKIKMNCKGIGFLLSVPIKAERESIENGYLLWIGSKESPGCKFLRNNVQFLNKEQVYLAPEKEYTIVIERLDKLFRLFIDNIEVLSYQSYIPVVGGHFGILFRDAYFDISPLSIYSGSLDVQVNCLSIPDTFLMIKDYTKALIEYNKITHSFIGRSEGREAIFRAGLTLIMMGKNDSQKTKEIFEQSLLEFEKLHKTPDAPLEYLGKALVYQAEHNLEEETKCLELAIRMFPTHPLVNLLKEHIVFRLHETAQKDRIGAYTYALLTIRQMPSIYQKKEAQQFVKKLKLSWENLLFLESSSSVCEEKIEKIDLSIKIAFWLARPTSLYELSLEIPGDYHHRYLLLENILLSLMIIGYPQVIDFILNTKLQGDRAITNLKKTFAILNLEKSFEEKFNLLPHNTNKKFIYPLIKKHLTLKEGPYLLSYLKNKHFYKNLYIWALLLANKKEEACSLLEKEDTMNTSSDFFMLQGCCLAALEGKKPALKFFDTLIETSFPKIPTLLGHYLKGNIDEKKGWFKQSFLWEKLELYRQLTLYYHCLGMSKKAFQYEKMIEKEFLKSQISLNFI